MNKVYEIMKETVIYDSEENKINIVYNNEKKMKLNLVN